MRARAEADTNPQARENAIGGPRSKKAMPIIALALLAVAYAVTTGELAPQSTLMLDAPFAAGATAAAVPPVPAVAMGALAGAIFSHSKMRQR